MKTPEYLDLVRERLQLPSDYALQKPLNVSKSQLSAYRTGKEPMSDAMALRVAEILGVNPGAILLDMHIERSKTPELRAVWSGLLDKLSASFTDLLLAHGLRNFAGVARR
ncbi:DUF3693 domain-containing protein [Pseudoduganella aquatica]|uniref:DUF3693 domain-containing protein n=1 Tax=Pseudoduganella aquatica TaxID=2660641 RepID=UPI001E464F41|nr:DUF3693 domain-containing protein [Pseudoduganella aquatica]